MKLGTSQLYNFEGKKTVNLCRASPLRSPGLGSLAHPSPPRAGSLAEEEVPLLFSQHWRTTTPSNPPQLRPVGKTTKLKVDENLGVGAGGRGANRPPPSSKITTSRLQERGSRRPSPQGPPEGCTVSASALS